MPQDQDGGGASPDFSLHVPFKHAALTLVGTPFSHTLGFNFFNLQLCKYYIFYCDVYGVAKEKCLKLLGL